MLRASVFMGRLRSKVPRVRSLDKYAGSSGFLGGATIHGLHGLYALRPNLTIGLPFGVYLKATIPKTAGQIMTLPSSGHW